MGDLKDLIYDVLKGFRGSTSLSLEPKDIRVEISDIGEARVPDNVSRNSVWSACYFETFDFQLIFPHTWASTASIMSKSDGKWKLVCCTL